MANFLDLPAELRIEIYEMVAFSAPRVFIKRKLRKKYENQRLGVTSALIAANKVINFELYSVVEKKAFSAPYQIQAIVTRYDFRHVMAFVKSCSAFEAAMLNPRSREGQSKIVITLRRADHSGDFEKLGKWIAFTARDGQPTCSGYDYPRWRFRDGSWVIKPAKWNDRYNNWMWEKEEEGRI
ncbi:hypothetical protein LTR37_013120 [Vermiconidia calcicola]|uniref:Uncharacterized protein n=1 Tax=Vermiconidia calcicola TaxID=1690605 RepID=A0ACC3MYZ3_9PEZI|nr:hypothetical protein LTR37_013120 [Vermiconidia calcicola]